MKVGIWRKG